MAPTARNSAALLFAVAAGAANLAYGQIALEPGLWRVMVNSTTNGEPQPPQDDQLCLEAELKDIAKYFSPEFEGVQAKCTRARRPTGDPNSLSYRMTCTGTASKFTSEVQSNVTLVSATHFKLSLKMNTKTPKESALVVAEGEAKRIGPCPKS